MGCSTEYSMINHVFKTTIDKTDIVAKANHLDHISSITITTKLSTGMFATANVRKKQLGTHVKSYVMAIGSLINMEAFEIQMMIENMFRTIPYSGKGLTSEQYKIKDGWEVIIRIPVSEFETRLKEFNDLFSKNRFVSQIESFDSMFTAESFIYNLNRNLQVLEDNRIKITEVNIGEIDRTPLLLAQFSNDTIVFLQLESDYKHFTNINLVKKRDESVSSFTHKEIAALLCFIPDRVKAASILLDNFVNNEFDLPVTIHGNTKRIIIVHQQDSDDYIFSIYGDR